MFPQTTLRLLLAREIDFMRWTPDVCGHLSTDSGFTLGLHQKKIEIGLYQMGSARGWLP